MALSSATIAYDISDKVGADFDARRTKVWVSTNIPGEVIADTVGNQIRVGDGLGDIADDGTGSVSVWVPGTGSNPTTWQTYIHFDYAQRRPGGARERLTFGPFTITTSANLADLIQEQEIPPTYLSTVTELLQGYVDSIVNLSGISTSDGVVQALIDGTAGAGPLTRAALAAAVVDPHDVGLDGIVLAGQSNMVSQGTGVDTVLDVTSERIKQWPGSGAYVGQVIAASDPLYHREQRANTVGSGPAFARKYARTIKGNRAVCLLPAAMSSTGFTTSSLGSPPAGYTFQAGGGWDPSGGQGGINLYQLMLAQITSFLAADPKNRLTALLWCQGEADTAALTQAQYAAKLDALIAGVRGLPGVSSTLPVVVISMIPERIASSGQVQAVDAAHIQTQARLTSAAYVYGPTNMNLGDNLHYTAAGMRVIGNDLLLPALLRARANVLGVAPVAPTSVALTQSTTTVTATITRPEGRFTDFETQYRRNNGTWTAITSPATKPTDIYRTITGLTLGDVLEVRSRSINEQGSSAWTSATLTLATLPAQVAGLTLGTATVSTQPLSWTAVSSATSYLVEYKAAASGTWLQFGTVTTTSTSVTGLTSATSHNYRVSAINAAGTGTASATATGSTAAPTMLLDDINAVAAATAYRAYGLRKLRAAYAGSAVKVRRSSDNTTLDIGFTVGGDLDEAALTAFVGANSAYIDTWYDQGGGARDLTNTTAAQQARIVNAGTVDKLNSKPVAIFDGTDDRYQSTTGIGLYAAGSASELAVVASAVANNAFGTLVTESDTGTAKYALHLSSSSGALTNQIFDDANTQTTVGAATGDLRTGVLHQISVVDSGTAINDWLNGTAQTVSPTSYTRAGRTLTLSRFALGALYATFFWKGSVSEVVLFSSALSTGQRQAGQTNEKSYYATA